MESKVNIGKNQDKVHFFPPECKNFLDNSMWSDLTRGKFNRQYVYFGEVEYTLRRDFKPVVYILPVVGKSSK